MRRNLSLVSETASEKTGCCIGCQGSAGAVNIEGISRAGTTWLRLSYLFSLVGQSSSCCAPDAIPHIRSNGTCDLRESLSGMPLPQGTVRVG